MENYPAIEFSSLIISPLLYFLFLFIYPEERLTNGSSFSDQIDRFLGENIPLGEKVDFLIQFFNACEVMALKDYSVPVPIFWFIVFFAFFLPLFYCLN